jgi:protein-S-isoprenylcysteine O-methyltransferase
MEAFLYNNGWNYTAAQTLGFTEFLLEWYFLPHTKVVSITTYAGISPKKPPFLVRFSDLGFALLVIGQFFRSAAMIEASSNFSHKIAEEKKSSHELVTSGVYSLVRHPSYFGFFWWSIGTQVFLANPLATVVFMGVLWRFFSARIQYRPSFLALFLGCNFLIVKS